MAPSVFKTALAANIVAGGFDSLPPPPTWDSRPLKRVLIRAAQGPEPTMKKSAGKMIAASTLPAFLNLTASAQLRFHCEFPRSRLLNFCWVLYGELGNEVGRSATRLSSGFFRYSLVAAQQMGGCARRRRCRNLPRQKLQWSVLRGIEPAFWNSRSVSMEGLAVSFALRLWRFRFERSGLACSCAVV